MFARTGCANIILFYGHFRASMHCPHSICLLLSLLSQLHIYIPNPTSPLCIPWFFVVVFDNIYIPHPRALHYTHFYFLSLLLVYTPSFSFRGCPTYYLYVVKGRFVSRPRSFTFGF